MEEEVVVVDTCLEVFKINIVLFLVTEWRSVFAWHFQSRNICTSNMYPCFECHCLGSEKRRDRFPTSYKTSFLLPSGVYLRWAERPSLWLFDLCESQDDLIPWWVAELNLGSNRVYFAGSGQMFVSSAPILYGVSSWCWPPMSANKGGKQKQTQAWAGATLLCFLCSRSVEMKPSALSLYISLMLWCTRPFIISWSLNCRCVISSIIPVLNLLI